MKVFTNGYDWVIANDRKDIDAVFSEFYGEGDIFWNEPPWEEVPDDELIYVVWEDGAEPDEVIITTMDAEVDENYYKVTGTARQWADLHGRGFLCTTEY